MNVIIALLLHLLFKNDDFTQKKRKGNGEFAVYLMRHGLEYQDVVAILGSPLASVRELVSRGSRKKH